jgi:hypothetical protein
MHIRLLKNFASFTCLIFALFATGFQAFAAEPVVLLSTNTFWKYNDESIELPATWITANYNDSAWSNSRPAMGFSGPPAQVNETLPPSNIIRSVTNAVIITSMTNVTPTMTNIVTTTNYVPGTTMRIRTPTNAARNIITYYFRTHFTFTNDPGGMILTASNLIDDGAVFYLNGRELPRVAMPEGPVNWGTLATRTDDIGANPNGGVNLHGYDVFSIPVDALVQGDNVMAVEVHQGGAGSTDMIFQMELWASFPAPTQLTITNEPQDVVVKEGDPVSLRVGVSGDGAHYHWFRQGTQTPIPGAIGETYSIAAATINDSGLYYVTATNLVNAVTSRAARVTVFLDTNGPILLDADGSRSTTNVVVTFGEAILPTTATNIANYKITNTLGGTLFVTGAALLNTTNVLLTTTNSRVANNNYLLIVSGVRDISPRQNLIAPNSMFPISNLATNVISLGDGWRFYNPIPFFGDLPDLGTSWRNLNYNEPNFWGNGTAIFVFGPTTTIVPGPQGSSLDQSDGVISYYRHLIPDLQISPGVQQVLLTHVIDDGAVIYVNGTEIFRTNMPAGPVNYQTRASATVGNPSRIGPIAITNVLFQPGPNVVAVELHQLQPLDTDALFGLQLDAYVRSVPIGPVIVTGGPADVTAIEGQTATFQVVQVGGSSFQWQQNNANINGATAGTYITPPVSLAMNGTPFRVIVTGASGSVTSTNARLTVVADTNAPRIVSAFAESNSIIVSFSEAMNAASANTVGNYLVTNSAGTAFPVTTASLTDGTNVALSFASLPLAQYFVVVNRVKDASTAGNVIATNSAVKVGVDATVIDYAGTWRYEQSGLDLSAQGWTNRTFNDGAWLSGPGLLDGKSGTARTLPFPIGTVILAPTNGPGGRFLTNTYFRGHFNLYGSGTGTVTFSTFVDDGYVMYLNGVEMKRTNMPAGTVTAATFASAGVGDGTNQGPHTFIATNLVAGDNVIAVEVHQNALGSSDVTWGGQFAVSIPSMVLLPPSTNACIPNPVAAPRLLVQRATGTNVVLSWTNPLDSCGNPAIFTLQQTLAFSNNVSATVWSDITTVNPYTAVGTNTTRFFRLKR